jgi:hypothetical protein
MVRPPDFIPLKTLEKLLKHDSSLLQVGALLKKINQGNFSENLGNIIQNYETSPFLKKVIGYEDFLRLSDTPNSADLSDYKLKLLNATYQNYNFKHIIGSLLTPLIIIHDQCTEKNRFSEKDFEFIKDFLPKDKKEIILDFKDKIYKYINKKDFQNLDETAQNSLKKLYDLSINILRLDKYIKIHERQKEPLTKIVMDYPAAKLTQNIKEYFNNFGDNIKSIEFHLSNILATLKDSSFSNEIDFKKINHYGHFKDQVGNTLSPIKNRFYTIEKSFKDNKKYPFSDAKDLINSIIDLNITPSDKPTLKNSATLPADTNNIDYETYITKNINNFDGFVETLNKVFNEYYKNISDIIKTCDPKKFFIVQLMENFSNNTEFKLHEYPNVLKKIMQSTNVSHEEFCNILKSEKVPQILYPSEEVFNEKVALGKFLQQELHCVKREYNHILKNIILAQEIQQSFALGK